MSVVMTVNYGHILAALIRSRRDFEEAKATVRLCCSQPRTAPLSMDIQHKHHSVIDAAPPEIVLVESFYRSS